MDFVADVYQLTQDFMNDYPEASYPELMHKLGRPYSCLLVDTHYDYYICIPFRSHINHKNSFMFHGTQRSMRSKSGLDYTKIILTQNNQGTIPSSVTGGEIHFIVKDCFGNEKEIKLPFVIKK